MITEPRRESKKNPNAEKGASRQRNERALVLWRERERKANVGFQIKERERERERAKISSHQVTRINARTRARRKKNDQKVVAFFSGWYAYQRANGNMAAGSRERKKVALLGQRITSEKVR